MYFWSIKFSVNRIAKLGKFIHFVLSKQMSYARPVALLCLFFVYSSSSFHTRFCTVAQSKCRLLPSGWFSQHNAFSSLKIVFWYALKLPLRKTRLAVMLTWPQGINVIFHICTENTGLAFILWFPGRRVFVIIFSNTPHLVILFVHCWLRPFQFIFFSK